MVRGLPVLLVFLSFGCSTTPSRAELMREQLRVRRGGSWNDRWVESQKNTLLWRTRFELCEQARAGANIAPLTLAEVEAACSADAVTLQDVRDAPPEDLDAAARWARGPMQNPRLADELVCRAAEVPPLDAGRQLACADVHLSMRNWSVARPLLMGAFEQGSPEQKCAVVRTVDQFSPSARQDVASFPAEVVRRCRASAPVVAATPLDSGDPPADAPPTRAAPVVAERPAPMAAEPPAAPEGRALPAGLQLNAELGTAGAALGVGYAWGGFALSLVPGFAFASAGPVSNSALSLGVAARFYIGARTPGALSGVLRPELSLASGSATLTSATGTVSTLTLGMAGGAEYLVSEHFGVTADLALRFAFVLGVESLAATLVPSLGVTLHL